MRFRVIILAFVTTMFIFARADSEIHIVRKGDNVELKCSVPYNYYGPSYHDYSIFVSHTFNPSSAIQVWSTRRSYYNEYYRNSGRFKFEEHSSDITLSILNLQLSDAGTYSCRDHNARNIANHIVIVIGKEVNLSINDTGKNLSLLSDNSTILECSFEISSHPWPNEIGILQIEGAVGSDTIVEGSTVRRKFAVTSKRSRWFTCKVNLPLGTFLESSPILLISKDVEQEDENIVIRRGDSSLLLACSTLQPTNKRWKWFKEKLYYGNQLSFPIVNCIIKNSTEECFNQTSQHFLEDVSTQAYTFLRFINISFEATGSYVCADDLFTVQRVFNVIVVDGMLSNMTMNDELIENNSTFEIKRGSTVTITCSIMVASAEDEEGMYHPKLIVENAQYVNHTEDGVYLIYTYETIVNQSGSFNCFVEIPNNYQVIGNFSNYIFNIDVFYCPEKLEIFSEMENGTLERGTILSCKTSAIPAANVTWSSANKVLRIETGPNYADLRVYEKMVYTCQSKPTFHTTLGHCQSLETTFEPKLVVSRQYLEVPRFVQLGELVTLQCTTHHHKNNNWKWIRNWNSNSNAFLDLLVDCLLEENVDCSNISESERFRDYSSSSETQLILPSADLGDIGNYTCFDSLRTVIKTFKVNAFVCPSKLAISRKNVKGETELNCSVTSNPAVNVTWTLSNHPNQPLAAGLNSVRLVVTQNGSYRCFVPQTSHSFLGKCGELSFIEIIESYPQK